MKPSYLIIILLLLMFGVYAVIDFITEPSQTISLGCSDDKIFCAKIDTYNGGATTSYYNKIYLSKNDGRFILLFSVDLASPEEISSQWEGRKIKIIIPDCKLMSGAQRQNYGEYEIINRDKQNCFNPGILSSPR